MESQNFSIPPEGPFSLTEAALFGFGQRSEDSWDGVMRLSFCLDGYSHHGGVELRGESGVMRGVLHADAAVAPPAVQRQVARVLSLDHDGPEFTRIAERDPVIARLVEV